MKYHSIDNDLIKNYLIHADQNNDVIKKDLIDWHLALNKGDDEECTIKAKNLIKSFVDESISFLGVNTNNSKQDLFHIYGSLENILRIAVFLRKEERIRDHLNHTIRNILFSTYLMNNVWRINDVKMRNKLILACAFHDIAYPIEKLKKVAKQIINSTLGNLINSDGKIDINISDPDKLLELIDFVGKNFESDSFSDEQKAKINILYRFTIIPAIADKGIFETKHCLSSTVIFLRYLYDYSDIGKSILRDNLDDILDICFAISYHDRERDISQLPQLPEIVKILRATDELQEWDRDTSDYSYCLDALLDIEHGTLIHFKMKDKANEPHKECDPYLSISDKISGIYKCLNNVTLRFEFPLGKLNVKELETKLKKKFKNKIKIRFSNYEASNQYNIINMQIINNNIIFSC